MHKTHWDWDKTFREAHLHSWPTASLSIQNTKPHETAFNTFKDDEREIRAAALKHGYRIVSPPNARIVSFAKPVETTQTGETPVLH